MALELRGSVEELMYAEHKAVFYTEEPDECPYCEDRSGTAPKKSTRRRDSRRTKSVLFFAATFNRSTDVLLFSFGCGAATSTSKCLIRLRPND
jgi:hypothetical protein